jgi:hypothetical protein
VASKGGGCGGRRQGQEEGQGINFSLARRCRGYWNCSAQLLDQVDDSDEKRGIDGCMTMTVSSKWFWVIFH